MKALKFFAFALSPLCALAAKDLVFDDFEGASYGSKWNVEGEAFGKGPAKGAFPGQQSIGGYNGDFLVNSYFNGGDSRLGKLTSKAFKIQRKFLTALVGGGADREKLYLRVLVEGAEVGRLSGRNAEKLSLCGIDLRPYLGKSATIEIVDDASGGWGHINVDDIRFTDNMPDSAVFDTTFNLARAKRYINIPINNSAPERRVKVADPEGKVLLFEGNLSVDFENPQWVYSMETRELEGAAVRIETRTTARETPKFETVDKYWAGNYPNELLRPQYHFTAPQGWLNDPNGLVYWGGKWHMYYQLTPCRVGSSGLKYWGHAVSDDLIFWRHMPVAISAIYKASGGENSIWSGTAFADLKNRSGLFGKGGGLVFAYTVNGLGDYAGYSADARSIKTISPPISSAKGRDPCIFYHEPTSKWVVLRYEVVKRDESAPGAKKFVFYTSKDLKTWERGQVLDDFYECPYIVSMPVNGDRRNMKYLIFDARGECVVGDFDGEKFTPIGGRRPKFALGDAYAGQVFHNAPNGRTVNISWFRQHADDFKNIGMPFSQNMTLPAELSLVEKGGEYAVCAKPVAEIEKLYSSERSFENVKLDEAFSMGQIDSSAMLEVEVDISNAERFKIDLGCAFIEFVKRDAAYHIRPNALERRQAETRNLSWSSMHYNMGEPVDGILKFKVFIDRCGIEVFHDSKKMIAHRMPIANCELSPVASGPGAEIKRIVLRGMKPAFSLKSLDLL